MSISEPPVNPSLEHPLEESSTATSDPSLWKTLVGSSLSGGIAYLAYGLMQAVVLHLPPVAAETPRLARSIGLLVRYLVVGSIALVAFMFGAVAVGLLAYSLQLIVQKVTPKKSTLDTGNHDQDPV